MYVSKSRTTEGNCTEIVSEGENIDAQAVSTDGRETLYMDDEIHMFGKGIIIKKQRRVLNIKNQYHLFFSFPT
jgi:hypothetical protein